MNRNQFKTLCTGVVPVIAIVASGCASEKMLRNPDLLLAGAPSSVSPERAAAVESIRRKAAAAENASDLQNHDPAGPVFQPVRPRRTYAEVDAVEAELRSIAEAQKKTSGAAELAALRRRASELEALRRRTAVDAADNTGSID